MFKNSITKTSGSLWFEFILANRYLICSLLLFSAFPIISTQLYFRHDDSLWLLWASEFDKPLIYIFHTDPQVNNLYGYGGMSDYYRPFAGLYMMVMQHIFGSSAFFFQLIGGLLLIGSIFFMFKIAELLSNKIAAFFSSIILFFCFHTIMNSLIHVAYPFLFFVQIGCFYFCMRGLVTNKLSYMLLSFIFLLPATSKQTTPFILLSIIALYFIDNWRTVFPNIKAKLFILLFTLSSFVVIPLSKGAGRNAGTIPSLGSLEMINFLKERLYYYGKILTTDITGEVMIFITLLYITFFVFNRVSSSYNINKWPYLLLIFTTFILTSILVHSGVISIYIFLFLLGICFWVNKATRCPLIWFFISFGIFLLIEFYNGSYLLEGAYGLSIAMGILFYSVLEQIETVLEGTNFLKKHFKRIAFVIVLIAVFASLLFFNTEYLPYSDKFKTMKVLINTNKNFSDMMDYLTKELPSDSLVYEISEETLGLTKTQSVLLSIRERAENKKVMNARDKEAMLRVSGRYDVFFKEISRMDELYAQPSKKNRYFVACNKLEKDLAENKYPLKLIKGIKRDATEAAVYIIE